MHFEHPHTSEIETQDLRKLHRVLEQAKEALDRKGGSIQNPIANSYLLEAESQIQKILKLDEPRYEAID